MPAIGSDQLEFVRRAYIPRERGGLLKTRFDGTFADEVLSHFDPEVEWEPSIAHRVEGRAYHGHAGLREWARDMADSFEELSARLNELTPVGDDHVIADVSWSFRGRESRIEQEERVGQLWTFRNGKVVRMRSFADPAKARTAAGL